MKTIRKFTVVPFLPERIRRLRDIALNLWSLYDFIVRELTAVNVRDDAQRLNPVEKVLLDLREGFAEAAIINRRAPQQVPAAETAEQRVVASF